MSRKKAGDKTPTMQDIALSLGVTKATVSLALAGDSRIPASTREKVAKAAKALDYVPHEAASRLARGRADALAFVAPRFAAPAVAALLEGLEERAFSQGRYLRGIRPYSTFSQSALREEILREILLARKAEAVILLSLVPSKALAADYRAHGMPLVLLEADAPGVHSLRFDQARGAYLATEALLRQGRRRIAFFDAPARARTGFDAEPQAQERLKGHLAALREFGVSEDKARILSIRHPHADEGAHALEACVRRGLKLDAVFCAAGDAVALGVLEAARFLKLRVPQDLALAGFGDSPASVLLQPALSSVHLEYKELGSLAFDTVLEALEGRLKGEKKIVLEPEWVPRESI